MGDARNFLKSATAAAHRALDDNPLVSSLAGGTLSLPLYRAMLEGYLDFFAPWEKEFRAQHPSLATRLGIFRFRKHLWLQEDLRELGAPSRSSAGAAPLPVPDQLPPLAGMLYVIEGSTLGGMHLSRIPGGLPGNAGRFFQGYGPETLPAWRDFVEWLDRTLITPDALDLAADAATGVFDWFQRRFDQAFHDSKSGTRD